MGGSSVVENPEWPESCYYPQLSYMYVYFKVVSDVKWIAKMNCTRGVTTH